MAVFRKGTLLIPTGPAKHLHIIMNDPVYSLEHQKKCVLVVNISTIKDGLPYDHTCTLASGDHPFIRHSGYVYYKGAEVVSAPRLIDRISLGEVNIMEPVSDSIYIRVLEGFGISKFVAFKI